jgi:hypothetical protein
MIFFSLYKADNEENTGYLIDENSSNKVKYLLDISNVLQCDSYQFKTLNGESGSSRLNMVRSEIKERHMLIN